MLRPFACPTCQGSLLFDPQDNQWECLACGRYQPARIFSVDAVSRITGLSTAAIAQRLTTARKPLVNQGVPEKYLSLLFQEGP